MIRNTRSGAAPRLGALALAIGALGAWPACAQQTPSTEHVEVIGQAARIDAALKQQRASDNIESVVHADAISQLPDDNAAEALQRLPGLSVERDQGEGRYVSVRGLGPDLNSVTINGVLVPAPESGRRAVALDVLPAELVQSLTVVKSLTPDMDANSLGGTVKVETLSAFDHPGTFFTLSGEGAYDGNTGQTSPKLSGAFSQRFDAGGGTDNFGVAAAFSWQQRDFGSDNVETGGGWDFDDGARLEETEQRDYRIRRERTGLGLNFDYLPDADSKLYLRTLVSRFADTETRNALAVEFADAQSPGAAGDAEVVRALKSRKETQDIESYVFGGERRIGAWTVSGQLGHSTAGEDLPRGIASADFSGNDDFAGSVFSSTRKPVVRLDAGAYDPTGFTLDEVEIERSKTTDRLSLGRLDLARDYVLGDHAAQFKFGAKLSRRTKKNDTDTWVYEDLDDVVDAAELSLDRFTGGKVDSSLGRFGNGISATKLRRFLAGFDAGGYYDEEESRINDYTMHEDIDAGYFMNSIDIDAWRIIAGLRYERTRFEARGTGLRDGEFEAVERSKDYDHWLPGLHVRYRLDRNTALRAAWTKSVVRPTFEQLAPGFVIDGDEAEFGNPDLKPLESRNLDLGIEHYLGRAGVVSAFAFHKRIRNFIYNADVAGSGDWADFDEAATFANGDTARVYGLELAYSQKFDWLPSPWNGLLLGANATFSRSRATIAGYDDGDPIQRRIDLPNHSDVTGNLTIGWEDARTSLRLAANYKSKYLLDVGAIEDRAHDLYVDDQLFLDFSARHFVTPQLQVYFQAQNLTDEPYYVYTGRRHYNAQYEEYGRNYKIGLTYSSRF